LTEHRTQNLPTGQAGTGPACRTGRHRLLKGLSKRVSFILCLCSVFWVLGSAVMCSVVEAGPTVNKRFVYYVYWMGIRAGKAVLKYKNTPGGIIVQTQATSASFISVFYKVDDFAQSVLYPDGYPKTFILKVHEGFHRRHKITNFEPRVPGKPQKVIFNNVLDEEVLEFNLEEPAYDPLSAFYAITKTGVKIGETSYINIFDNKKFWRTEIQVLRKEKISVLAGEFNTILVKPLLESEGIFMKTGEMYIWLTDDDRRIPVRFTSKAIIGKFTAILAEADID
jgi:hypothetical protein